jgi:heme oxygenase
MFAIPGSAATLRRETAPLHRSVEEAVGFDELGGDTAAVVTGATATFVSFRDHLTRSAWQAAS